MARLNTKPEIIIDRIASRLREQIDECNPGNCYFAINPDDLPVPNAAEYVYVVSWFNGNFHPGMFDGGGINQAELNAIFAVTIHSFNQQDEVGRDIQLIADEVYGLAPRATLVLKALAGHDLQDDSGNEILSQPIFPDTFHAERYKRPRGSWQLGFHAVFDWDLS
jgi:hypothetical protein